MENTIKFCRRSDKFGQDWAIPDKTIKIEKGKMKTSSSQKPSTSRAASSSKIPDNLGNYVLLMKVTIFNNMFQTCFHKFKIYAFLI